ncbi:MAG: peptidase M28 [Sphingomonas sp.]|nr:peptidase M28 [Sphingomonas sp.]
MRFFIPALALITAALSAPVSAAPTSRESPDPARLRASVAALVGFGTRHTLSAPDDPKRGIGAARRWAGTELTRISDSCGGCITVANIGRGFTGERAPDGVQVVDVLGFQNGRDPKRMVIVMGHIDSRVSDVMDAVSDAPGANDDASGVALVLESARILSKERFDASILYAITSGEEQGLWGATLLADTAKEKGWDVVAVLNNDIVGNTVGQNGVKVDDRVRVFSEGIRASEDLPQQMARRADGGEDDGPSRALAKAVDHIADTLPRGLDVTMIRRPDRFGRGGDHSPFLALGYPAVRFSVGAENYDQQHQDLRTENGTEYGDTIDKMDFPYLAKVTAINVATIARLAAAPPAPVEVTLKGALDTDTTVSWKPVAGAGGYRIYWRPTDQSDWTNHVDVAADATSHVLKDVVVDNHFAGVAALSSSGAESLVTFGGRERR